MTTNPTPSATSWPSAASSPSSPPRCGRRAERAPLGPPAPRDAADVLAAVYRLILSWPLPEEREAAAEAAGGGE